MENIEGLWDRLQLMEGEDIAITITEEEVVEDVQRRRNPCLIGKIWMEQKVGQVVLEAAMA